MSHQYPEVVVGVILYHPPSQRILLTKSPKWTVWGIHGGHIEYGETISNAAVRETREEVGVEGRFVHIIQHGESLESPSFKHKKHVIYFHCLLECDATEVTPDLQEITDHRWVTLDEVATYETFQSLPPTIMILKEYLQRKNKLT